MPISSRTFCTLAGLAALLAWTSCFSLSSSLMGQVGIFTGIGAVYLLGGFLSIGVVALSNMRTKRSLIPHLSLRHSLVCGGLFIAYTVSLFVAIGLAKNKTEVMNLTMINYLWPTATLLASLVILGNRARGIMLISGTLLAWLGILIAVVVQNGLSLDAKSLIANFSSNPLAYLLALTAAITWALYSNFARLYAEEDSPYSVPVFILLSGIILFGASFLAGEVHDIGAWNLQAVIELFVLAALPTGLAYTLWGMAMQGGNMVLLMAVSYFSPLIASVFSTLYLGIEVRPAFWLACLAVIVGAMLSKMAVKEAPSGN